MNFRYSLCIAFVIILIMYLTIFLNTNSVVNNVENIMSGNVEKSITQNTPLDQYNRKGDFGTVKVDVKLNRLFVLHNFNKGYMWMLYTYEGYDKDNNRTYGAWNILSKWKIEKINGKWEVVNIIGEP